MKMDDIMDVDMQAAGADDESDDGDRKDQPPAFETLGQVKPTPLQSWLIKVMHRRDRSTHDLTSALRVDPCRTTS
jgi:hypothetical protein